MYGIPGEGTVFNRTGDLLGSAVPQLLQLVRSPTHDNEAPRHDVRDGEPYEHMKKRLGACSAALSHFDAFGAQASQTMFVVEDTAQRQCREFDEARVAEIKDTHGH